MLHASPGDEESDDLETESPTNRRKCVYIPQSIDISRIQDEISRNKVNSLSSVGESSTSSGSQVSKPYRIIRENPFNREMPFEDDHFSDYSRKSGLRAHSSASRNSESSDMNLSGTSDDISFADLGLSEDHFSRPEGHFGLSTLEELDLAIESCKDMILNVEKNSDRYKNLVKKLVQLRLKKQELKEGPEPVDDNIKVVVGHKFVLRSGKTSKSYCEKCNHLIWGILQYSYKCIACHYRCHDKCLNLITRTCASVKVEKNPELIVDICPIKGLSQQSYRCAECLTQLSFKNGAVEPRLCDYTGHYYCDVCHWNDLMVIPARVLHNWDFEKRKVCRASKQFLRLMSKRAVLRIVDRNPMLYNYVEELNDIKKLREELLIMKQYILVCQSAMENKLLLHLQNRQHFVDNSDIYSMQDLLDVQSDTLLPEIAQVHTSWAQHIKTDCPACQAKGFSCELCDNKEVLFPFDNIAELCSQCSCVFHRHCFLKKGSKCSRCERRQRKNQEMQAET